LVDFGLEKGCFGLKMVRKCRFFYQFLMEN